MTEVKEIEASRVMRAAEADLLRTLGQSIASLCASEARLHACFGSFLLYLSRQICCVGRYAYL
jgi:hypothetical protein